MGGVDKGDQLRVYSRLRLRLNIACVQNLRKPLRAGKGSLGLDKHVRSITFISCDRTVGAGLVD